MAINRIAVVVGKNVTVTNLSQISHFDWLQQAQRGEKKKIMEKIVFLVETAASNTNYYES